MAHIVPGKDGTFGSGSGYASEVVSYDKKNHDADTGATEAPLPSGKPSGIITGKDGW